jgi:hypothetical protein
LPIDIEIPDSLADVIAPGQDPARAALEAIALEGYCSDRLSEYDVQELLRFETRMEVHAFLKEQGVYLHYGQRNWNSICGKQTARSQC